MTTEIIHRSESQIKLLDKLKTVAQSSAEILISGPSGVGKELYAGFIHDHSPRADKPFVAVNCSNLSAEMIENEIFGHARGAFTGAVTAQNGIAAAAEGGTMFLDEIDTLPMPCQAKLLRFTQLREYRRLGEAFTRKSDVRLIATSNTDLLALVREGRFREDLFFRLRVVPIEIAPLSDRPDDIPVLIDHFAERYAQEYDTDPIVLSNSARRQVMQYSWPGNVRELENCVRYLTCLQLTRAVRPEDLSLLDELPQPTSDDNDNDAVPGDLTEVPMKEAKSMVVEGFEKMYIDSALRDTQGNVAKAARNAGKHRRAFFQLMRRYGFCAGDYRNN